ncbi:MAG: AIPR family protein [Clostridia bacterium]|nr:AIPR family protein [Clostridia bacterium]
MDSFNSKLISKIKMFHNDINSEEYKEEKYSFLLYVLEQLESVSSEEITICTDEFPSYKIGVDAYYFNEDSNVHNIVISIYNDKNNDDSILDDESYLNYIEMVKNLIRFAQTKQYKIKIEQSFVTYDICEEINQALDDCEIIVTILSNYNIDKSTRIDDVEEVEGTRVSFNTYDLSDLKERFSQLNNDVNVLDLKEKFGETIKALKISSTLDFDVYMCAFKGSWLATLYKEDGQRLLEPNVRSYLKRTQKTNAGILETVKSYPDYFVSYNNGLSSIASYCDFKYLDSSKDWCTINKIHNFQIVNGGQTTATLAECAKDKLVDELNDVVVPVKLTIIKNLVNAPTLINNISVYSNTQTAIKKSDPPSNLKYYIDLKNISREVVLQNDKGKNYICYFERTAGEYDTELKRNNSTVSFQTRNPKDKKFTKIQLGVAINCWQQLPYVVCLGREKNFDTFNNTVKNQMFDVDETYFKKAYATIILFRQIDKICKKLKLSLKSNVTTYTLSYISYLSKQKLDLISIFNNQGIDNYLKNIIENIAVHVHKLISNPPLSCPEPRMWARKEELWKRVKNLGLNYIFTCSYEPTNFYPENEPQTFINIYSNFNDVLLWKKLIIWNDKKKVLNKSQISMIKTTIRFLNTGTKMTNKQINYTKDIFMSAVKSGFNNYK